MSRRPWYRSTALPLNHLWRPAPCSLATKMPSAREDPEWPQRDRGGTECPRCKTRGRDGRTVTVSTVNDDSRRTRRVEVVDFLVRLAGVEPATLGLEAIRAVDTGRQNLQ